MPRKLVLLVWGMVVWGFVAWPQRILAIDCQVEVSPLTIGKGVVTDLNFSVTVTSSDVATKAKVVNGSVYSFSLESGSAGGWNADVAGDFVNFTDGTLELNQTQIFTVTTRGLEVTDPVSFPVSLFDGVNFNECSGGTEISVGIPSFAISNIVVSAGSNSAEINWTTTEGGTSVVSYGTTGDYGSTVVSESLSTSHSASLSGLNASTPYYYQVCSTNGSSEQVCSGGNTFTTSAVGTTTTTVTTGTTTTTSTTTPTPTPKVDRLPPAVSVSTDFKKPYEKAPVIVGKASDGEELSGVDYSTDGGRNWLPVDEFNGKGEKRGNWEFVPGVREDGNYEVLVRASDKTGNLGYSEKIDLIIDRLPPRVGGALWSIGPYALTPHEDGAIETIAGIDVRLSVGAVGGPTEISLVVGDRKYNLSRSNDTGLWSSNVRFETDGEFKMRVVAVDGGGNETQRDYGVVRVLPIGKVVTRSGGGGIKGGQVRVFWKDPLSEVWTVWDGRTFGQTNPVATDDEGGYRLMIPAGTYYIETTGEGMVGYRSKIFDVHEITPINNIFSLDKAHIIKLFDWNIHSPRWNTSELKIANARLKFSDGLVSNKTQNLNFRTPATEGEIDTKNLIGEPAVISFVNTWSPGGSEQISILNELILSREINGVVVVPMESLAGVKVYANRGGYKINLGVDSDGELVEKYNLTSLPSHYFLNRLGEVVEVKAGVLSKKELIEILSKY